MSRWIDGDHLRKWIIARWQETNPYTDRPFRADEILAQIDRELSIDINKPQGKMDETKVQIGEDVLLDIGTHSDWYISSIGYDGESVDVVLRRKVDRNKEWWLVDTSQTDCDNCRHYKLACELFSDICKTEPQTEREDE